MSDSLIPNFELLLPVGHKEMALAAIHNGADAIYVGFPQFNARGRSHDFDLEELNDLIQLCHLFGVKVNLALNVVIFEDELPKIAENILKVLPLKPDALIIQDLGLAELIRKIAPLQPIHASTQMTITNDLAIHFLSDLNIKRFVLGRENSLSEIKQIKEKTDKELEVFVHGALCVSYSGQCFTSESLGGRSANRGQCAQSCRFGYDLIVDGQKHNTLDKEFLVSPQDLCGIAEIPELMRLGVTSFKVEGRLKTPEYVASAAKEFRFAMDRFLARDPLNNQEIIKSKINMATHYSRGFFSGWLNGVNHQKLVDGSYSSHRGAYLGQLIAVDNQNHLHLELKDPITLNLGDGLLWARGKKEGGSFIYSLEKLAPLVYKIGISRECALDNSFLHAKVYLNHSKEQIKLLNKSFQDKNYLKKIPLTVEVQVELNQPLSAALSDGKNRVSGSTSSLLVSAKTKSLLDSEIKDEFASLGGSVFRLNEIRILRKSGENLFLNARELKNLRQHLVQELSQIRSNQRIEFKEVVEVSSPKLVPEAVSETPAELNSSPAALNFNVLLRDPSQVDSLIQSLENKVFSARDFNYVLLDFEFGRNYQNSVDLLKKHHLKVGIATTRILKPQEYGNLKNIFNLNPDAILVRNLGAIYYFQHLVPFKGDLLGDFSLNVTNHLSISYLLKKGLKSLCLSYDLNQNQVLEILKNSKGERLEVTVHQFMPSFHMEHCVFAAFLSQGSSFKDCGKPCEKHHVQLKDQFGHLHWIKPDHECRNTMYNAQAQTAIKYINGWKTHGLGSIRYEALYETGAELTDKIKNYLLFLKGHQTLEQTLSHLHTQEKYGLNEGTLTREHKYQSRKKIVDHDL